MKMISDHSLPEYLSIVDLTRAAGCTKEFIRHRIDNGSLPATHDANGRPQIRRADAIQFIETSREKIALRQQPDYKGPPNRAIHWTDEMLSKLGTATDSSLAREFGISTGAVQAKRNKLRIPAYFSRSTVIEWTPEMDAMLGTMADAELARRLGVSWGSVNIRRTALGVPAFRKKATSFRSNEAAIAAERRLHVTLSDVLIENLEAAKKVVERRLKDAGLVLSSVSDQQVIEIALADLAAHLSAPQPRQTTPPAKP